MRNVAYCLIGAVAALGFTEIASDGHSHALDPAAGMGSPAIDRSGRGDPAGHRSPSRPEHAIATVEIIGLDAAVVVFRDRGGRELYRTDPVANTTVVTRGVVLPEVTLSDGRRGNPVPMAIDNAGSPAPAATVPAEGRDQETERARDTLPEGCEPAGSLLSPLGASSIRARCLTSLDAPVKMASAAAAMLDTGSLTR